MLSRFHEITRLESWLIMWARWMRRNEDELGYPRKSSVLCSNNGQSWEDFEDENDLHLIAAVDAAIASLTPTERCAIHCAYLHAVYRFREPYDFVLERATGRLAAILRSKPDICLEA